MNHFTFIAPLLKQAHVGSRGYPNNLYAFELEKELPKFAMLSQVSTFKRSS